jgi:hypothetical protein
LYSDPKTKLYLVQKLFALQKFATFRPDRRRMNRVSRRIRGSSDKRGETKRKSECGVIIA